jgi:hypothetical protein
VGTCGQLFELTHMHPLRRQLDHRGLAYGLTRFACQTAFLKMQEYRSRIPHLGDVAEGVTAVLLSALRGTAVSPPTSSRGPGGGAGSHTK